MTKRAKVLAIAAFILAFCASDADAQSDIWEINRQINDVRYNIEQLRVKNPARIEKALSNNSDYRYVIERGAEVDSLRRKNERILDRAYRIVRSRDPYNPATRSTMLFVLYCTKYRDLQTLKSLYEMNRHDIENYEQHKAKADALRQRLKNHYDSIMYSEIHRNQMLMDSLLTRKMELVK